MAKFHRQILLFSVSLACAGCLVPIGDAEDDDASGGASGSGGTGAGAGAAGSSGATGGTAGNSGSSGSAGQAGSGGSGANAGRACPLPPSADADGVELPAPFFDLVMPVKTGTTHSVAAGDDLQAALDQVQPGDEIVLEAGATFVGNFTLRNLGAAEDWVIVRSSASDQLPETTRVTPADAGKLATLSSPSEKPVLLTNQGAHHHRFVGVRFTTAPEVVAPELISLGTASATSAAEQPHHLVFDRCIFQGDPKLGARLGIALGAAHTAVIDSHFADFKSATHPSEALAIVNGPGPLALINNHIEGGWHSLRLGGDTPSIAGLVPSDIAICQNHITKSLSWKKDDPTFSGVDQRIAYLVSIESAHRVLFSANVIDRVWDEDGFGTAVKLEPGNHAWASADDITFAFNIVRDVGSVFWVDSNTGSDPTHIGRIRMVHNLVYDVGVGGFTGVARLSTFSGPLEAWLASHNTVLVGNAILYFSGNVSSLVLRDNLLGPTTYGLFGEGAAMGTPTLVAHAASFSVDHNVFVGESQSNYPSGNFFPQTLSEVGFTNASVDDYHLIASSPYLQAASDGGPIGADVDQILALTSGVAP